MAFVCPECLNVGTLTITDSIKLPPDSRSDEIILQLLRCGRCELKAAAVYEESRRGAMGSESWHHIGYKLEEKQIKELLTIFSKCKTLNKPKCHCKAHRMLGQKDDAGRWVPPEYFHWKSSFPMRYARR